MNAVENLGNYLIFEIYSKELKFLIWGKSLQFSRAYQNPV